MESERLDDGWWRSSRSENQYGPYKRKLLTWAEEMNVLNHRTLADDMVLGCFSLFFSHILNSYLSVLLAGPSTVQVSLIWKWVILIRLLSILWRYNRGFYMASGCLWYFFECRHAPYRGGAVVLSSDTDFDFRYARIHRLGIKHLEVDDYVMIIAGVSFFLAFSIYRDATDSLLEVLVFLHYPGCLPQCHCWRRR